MGLQGTLKSVASPSWHRGQQQTVNLRTLLDPGDWMGGQAASNRLGAAEQAQREATHRAVAQRERMFGQTMAMGEPYRQMGYAALPKIQESLQAGSPLDRLRSDLTRGFMSGYLEKQGFGGGVAGEVTGQRLRRTGAAEATSRRGRARDLMALGGGQVAGGAGLVGARGTSQARRSMAAGAAQAEMLSQQAMARQNQMASLMYGGQRLAGDYLTRREAGRY